MAPPNPEMRPSAGVIVRKKKDIAPKEEAGLVAVPMNDEERREKESELLYLYNKELNRFHISLNPPSIDDFKVGTAESREEDKKLVERLEKKDGPRGSEAGFLLERMAQVEVARSGWFGNPHYFRTTDYDDRKHVDAVLEWESKHGPVRLALDMTTNPDKMGEKTAPGRHFLPVKYFRSLETKPTAALKEMSLPPIPAVVLAMDSKYTGLILEAAKKEKAAEWTEDVLILEMIGQLLQRRKDLELSRDAVSVARKFQVDSVLDILLTVFKKTPPPNMARLKKIAAQSRDTIGYVTGAAEDLSV